ncbi:MAG: helix-turn-helix domain-containing protein [Roseibium sp.]|nr:helix-turn-helix domain-containing protein [Roseibium sp.]
MTSDEALAGRIAALRQERSLTLDDLADASGVSRATLSRIERGQTSPTAAVLGQLAAVFQVPMAAFFPGEGGSDPLLRHDDQAVWQDPGSGFVRRNVSPPLTGYCATVIEGTLPAGQHVSYRQSPLPGLEHHLVMVSGVLEAHLGSDVHTLRKGDCLRFRLSGGNTYRSLGPHPARYLLFVVAP